MNIAALAAASPWLDREQRSYALGLADDWNERLESWCYFEDTPLARELGVRRNRDGESLLASALVSLDFSYLVRLGLRHPLDPRVRETIRVVDHVLKVETQPARCMAPPG